ncbi:MAG TPA: hypothetical protein VIJ51_08905 [Solirubrobacteraceae bacterium]
MPTVPCKPKRVSTSRWYLPAFSVSLGLVLVAAFWIGGHPAEGLGGLGVMTVLALVSLLGGRSETIRGIRGDGRDERFAMIDLRASATAGLAVIVAVIVGFMVEVGEGHSGNPYAWLGAIGGVVYVVAIGVLRSRT